jgi:hypothetical protein
MPMPGMQPRRAGDLLDTTPKLKRHVLAVYQFTGRSAPVDEGGWIAETIQRRFRRFRH